MLTELFDYSLPEELIAQSPGPRGQSRLLVLNRNTGLIQHRRFSDLPEYLRSDDTLVFNNTRVSARRIHGLRENGKPAEVLLLEPVGSNSWHVLVKPGVRVGQQITLRAGSGAKAGISANAGDKTMVCTVTAVTESGGRMISVPDARLRDSLLSWGETPLPPYIKAVLSRDQEERYQTVYGRIEGSAAAPTAGLHFTDEMITKLSEMGIRRAMVTLSVGVGTFRPVRSASIGDHEMHSEWMCVEQDAADAVNNAAGRVIAVGTTTVRALESSIHPKINAAANSGCYPRAAPFVGRSNLFISPGHAFRSIDGLITNFHQPKSTLLMMISAFAGRELIMKAYAEAVLHKYRFFSFGDAMLIISGVKAN